MRFIIEFDGPIVDPVPAYFDAHCAAAGLVGWSRLEKSEFRRRIRAKGMGADVLPGSKPIKLERYAARFEELIESDQILGRCEPHPGVAKDVQTLARHGQCNLMSLGTNLPARRRAVALIGLATSIPRLEMLSGDPRKRPAELGALAGGEPRTVVVASSDTILRAARLAGLFSAGLSCGACSLARLQQAGADITYRSLHEFALAIADGARDMIRAGLPPLSPG